MCMNEVVPEDVERRGDRGGDQKAGGCWGDWAVRDPS